MRRSGRRGGCAKLQAAQELAEAERLRAEEQVQATRRLRRRLGLLVGTLVVALALGVLAVLSRRDALRSRARGAGERTRGSGK